MKPYALQKAMIAALCFAAFCVEANCDRSRATVTDVSTVTIWGDIKPEDVGAFQRSLANGSIHMVQLNSEGGDPYAAMAIGRLVRANQLHITVISDGQCLGSCALIYVAGVNRTNYGTVGLQLPNGSDKTSTPADQTKLSLAIRAYIAAMDINEEFARKMLNPNPGDTLQYDGDIIELVAPYDPSYWTDMVASSAHDYGVSVQEYSRRQREGSSCPANSPTDDEDCRNAMMWGLKLDVYRLRDKLSHSVCAAEEEAARSLAVTGLIDTVAWWKSPQAIELHDCKRRVMLGS